MEQHVVLADAAKVDAENLYRWAIEKAPLRGPEWFEKLLESLYSLNHNPSRCPLAQEARRWHRVIRNLLYGKPGRVYRILFEVDEERRTVRILHIRRHLGMRNSKRKPRNGIKLIAICNIPAMTTLPKVRTTLDVAINAAWRVGRLRG